MLYFGPLKPRLVVTDDGSDTAVESKVVAKANEKRLWMKIQRGNIGKTMYTDQAGKEDKSHTFVLVRLTRRRVEVRHSPSLKLG